jgi:protocatechuate 3,4-dioxygenase beta subunit
MRLLTAIAIALLSGELTNLLAQEPLIVRGRVVRADDPSLPLPRARIAFNGSRPADRIFTDDQGRFEITVPAASTTLTVSKPPFVTTTLPLPKRDASEPLEIPLVLGAAVNGRVIDPAGQLVALSGVRVRSVDAAQPAAVVPVSAVTDDRGEFHVGGLAPGRYQVFASFVYDPKEQLASDLAPSALLVGGMVRPTPEAVTVTLQAAREVFVTLNHQEPAERPAAQSGAGAVTGVVVDDFGEPLQGLRVRLWQGETRDGRRVIKPLDFTQATDERGRYRTYDVPPGRYFVSVDDPAGVVSEPRFTADTPVFYPQAGTPADALEIEVGSQQEAAGINVVFRARRQARVRGSVFTAAGQPYTGSVTLAAAFHPGEPAMAARTVVSDASGAFQFENVATGEYIVRAAGNQGVVPTGALIDFARLSAALRSVGSAPSEFGAQRVTVSGEDPPPVTVTTAPWSSIMGRIVFEGRAFSGDPAQITILAVPDDLDMAPGVRQAGVKRGPAGSNEWTLELSNIVGPVRLVAQAPAPWWLKSVESSVAHTPDELLFLTASGAPSDLTLLLADTGASVSGRVQDGRPQADNLVVLFSTDERRWYIRSPYTKTSKQGNSARFTIEGIPPGEYFITAVDLNDRPLEGEWWTDREVLLTLAPSAQRIKLAEGQSFTTTLRLVPAPF